MHHPWLRLHALADGEFNSHQQVSKGEAKMKHPTLIILALSGACGVMGYQIGKYENALSDRGYIRCVAGHWEAGNIDLDITKARIPAGETVIHLERKWCLAE
jgi:hypothetical protein